MLRGFRKGKSLIKAFTTQFGNTYTSLYESRIFSLKSGAFDEPVNYKLLPNADETYCLVKCNDNDIISDPISSQNSDFFRKSWDSSFYSGDQPRYIVGDADFKRVDIIDGDYYHKIILMSALGLNILGGDDTWLLTSNHESEQEGVIYVITTAMKVAGMTLSEIQPIIIDLCMSYKYVELMNLKLLMKFLRSTEFVNRVGKQWSYEQPFGSRDGIWSIESLADDGVLTNTKAVVTPHFNEDKPVTNLDFCQTSACNVAFSDGEYVMISSASGSGDSWLLSKCWWVKIDYSTLTLSGIVMTTIPVTDYVKLEGVTLSRSIIAVEDKELVVEISGDNIIKVTSFDECIRGNIVRFIGSGTLTMKCSDYSSIIGWGAQSQSYGRYVPSYRGRGWEGKITIEDGVKIVFDSETPNFSMGAYGMGDNKCSFEISSGGELIGCPELDNDITLKSVGITSHGSTKIEGPAVYKATPKPCDGSMRNSELKESKEFN